MKTVRPSVFETNSSSVHTLCLCTEDQYKKFLDKEMFWKDEKLCTLDEAYDDFCIYLNDNKECDSYSLDRFDGKVPSKELFEKAIKEDEWQYEYNVEERDEYESDEQWYIALIQWWLVDHEYGNCENYFNRYDDWYETYEKTSNGMTAFGYFGRDG